MRKRRFVSIVSSHRKNVTLWRDGYWRSRSSARSGGSCEKRFAYYRAKIVVDIRAKSKSLISSASEKNRRDKYVEYRAVLFRRSNKMRFHEDLITVPRIIKYKCREHFNCTVSVQKKKLIAHLCNFKLIAMRIEEVDRGGEVINIARK